MNFEKLHGCLPKMCKCKGGKKFQPAFSSDTYLKPMVKVIEEMSKVKINTVS